MSKPCNNVMFSQHCTLCGGCPLDLKAVAAPGFLEAQQAEPYFRDTYQQAVKQAADNGCYIVLPKLNEIQVDIDSGEQYALFDQQISILAEHFPNIEVSIKPSKSGLPKRHITITFSEDLEDEMRVALQASLGSDPKRELLNCVRILQGQDNPILFFEKKVAA